jgi:hypothetical protein
MGYILFFCIFNDRGIIFGKAFCRGDFFELHDSLE